MPHNRRPKPGSKYFLPKYEYLTVVNFCLSYNGLKQRYAALGGARALWPDGMPHGENGTDSTATEAMLAETLRRKIDIIESTVRECTGEVLYRPMLHFITNERITFEQLCTVFEVPMGKNQFSQLRRRIYWGIARQI